jgi:hypothetical protein
MVQEELDSRTTCSQASTYDPRRCWSPPRRCGTGASASRNTWQQAYERLRRIDQRIGRRCSAPRSE